MNEPRKPVTVNARADVCCVDCGRVAFRRHTDGKHYCWRCLDTVRNEEYERQLEREEER